MRDLSLILRMRDSSRILALWEYARTVVDPARARKSIMSKVRVRKARDLSATLAAARRQRGWTQAELADRIGVSRDYVGDIESGRLGVQAIRLMQMFGELGVEVVLTMPEPAEDAGPSHG